ncbi:DEAD/DEAH box helicase [Salipaludibacillus sp. HK11]|uniref:DEAD/DEAH box helicase n=1 Tax=Salipaludibacillus sp. HK11 TaxID=3394320 RepID=UPI0039FCE46E
MRFYLVPLDDSVSQSLVPPHVVKHLSHKWLIPEPLLNHKDKLNIPLVRLSDLPPDKLEFPSLNTTFQINEEVENMIKGRRLLLDEVIATIPLDVIYDHICNGYIRYQSAINRKPKLTCVRCGNDDPFLFGEISCARCVDKCAYCRACIQMGKVTECSPLLTWHGEESAESRNHPLGWEGELSPAQDKASEALVTHVMSSYLMERKFLIWAVCGAGKTEMLFEAIQSGLAKGDSVLIATPRTDVVLELLPRMVMAFPNTVVRAFHGGVKPEERYAQAELVIATTHQLLRFYDHFPLAIIDEVDAFPFSYDKKLQYAVECARSKQSLTVYVTATPSDELKRRVNSGELAHVKVPRRYHGFDLPVPKRVWVGDWRKKLEKNVLPMKVINWIQRHVNAKKQVFLFVAKISLMATIEEVLKSKLDTVVESVHASDPDRREKVSRFRAGEMNVLVTTTILERGVTIKGVQVGVLGAEDRIFTESALVQIAGRVGRSADEHDGDVIFFHYGNTNAIVRAVRHIEAMNDQT